MKASDIIRAQAMLDTEMNYVVEMVLGDAPLFMGEGISRPELSDDDSYFLMCYLQDDDFMRFPVRVWLK